MQKKTLKPKKKLHLNSFQDYALGLFCVLQATVMLPKAQNMSSYAMLTRVIWPPYFAGVWAMSQVSVGVCVQQFAPNNHCGVELFDSTERFLQVP